MADEIKRTVVVEAEARNMKQAAAETRKFAKEMGKLDKAFQENIKTQEHTRQALIKLTNAGEEATAEWSVLHKELDKLGAAMERQEQAIKEYTAEMEDADDATEAQVKAARKLNEETKETVKATERQNEAVREGREAFDISRKAIQQTEVSLERLNEEQKESTVAQKAQGQAIQQTATQMKRLDLEQDEAVISAKASASAQLQLRTELERTKQAATFLGVETSKLKGSLVTALGIGGVMGLAIMGVNLLRDAFNRAAEAAKQFVRESVESFSNLEEEVARTRAQIPELIQSQEELYTTAVKTAREVGRAPLETQTAIRKAINLGFTYQEALDAVRISTDAARVANADMTETLITGISTVNAYGVGVYDLSEVLDQYAYITQNSNLEMSDLISGMAKIISPAAEAGVSLEEVAAAMITMNRQGDDFTEIADLLGNTLTQIAVRGTVLGTAFEEAAGVGFREFTAAGGTLIEGLQLIELHADDTEQSISELVQGNSKFYRDMLAGRGVLELTGRHTAELAEAYDGATKATGTLDQQTAEFADTLYYANEQMEASKGQAQALFGESISGWAHWWTKQKEDFFEGISEAAVDEMIFADMRQIAMQSNERLIGAFSLDALIDPRGIFTMEQRVARAEEIGRLYERNNYISLEELDIGLQIFQRRTAQKEIEKAILDHRLETLAVEKSITDEYYASKEYSEANLSFATAAASAEQERLQEIAEKEELLIAKAKKRAEQEAVIAALLLEQRMHLAEAYNSSKGIIDNISGLQEELAITTDAEGVAELEQQLEEAGDAIDKQYRQNVIDAMIASDGWTESITDLAVEMGLITKEAGELQKEYIRITTETEKLGKMKGFQDLGIEEQAIAAEALADGLVRTAEGAYALVDAGFEDAIDKFMKDAKEGFKISPTVTLPEEDLQKVRDLEADLGGVVDEEWAAILGVDPGTSYEDLNDFHDHLIESTPDREVIITVTTVENDTTTSTSKPEDTLAGGGSFTVPAGYNADNYLIGVSSGENVNVTPAGLTPSSGAVTVSVVNHFAAGFTIKGRSLREREMDFTERLKRQG